MRCGIDEAGHTGGVSRLRRDYRTLRHTRTTLQVKGCGTVVGTYTHSGTTGW
jgi:hypothetical protein